jgi:hypothetical protein
MVKSRFFWIGIGLKGQFSAETRTYPAIFDKALALVRRFAPIGRSCPVQAITSAWAAAPRLML